jgi:hypothetical protein
LSISISLETNHLHAEFHAAHGTVRAQATSIYSKSNTLGHPQVVSLFVEELMSDDFGDNDLSAHP